MHASMRWISALCLTSVGTLALAGCGTSQSTTASGPVSLTFEEGIQSPQTQAYVQQEIHVFEKQHPNIHITMQNYGAADSEIPKIESAVAAHNPPNLLWIAPAYTGQFASSNAIVEAQKYFHSEKFNSSTIFPGLLKTGVYKGKVWTMPFDANDLAVYYNKKLFKQAGIKTPPATWQQFLTDAKKLTHDGTYGFEMPIGNQEWTVWIWETLLWQAGGHLLNSTRTKVTFDSPAGVKALNYWVTLMKDHVATFGPLNQAYQLGDFESGKVAMMINGPWNYSALQQQHQVDYGAFPLPKDKIAATNIGGESLFIFNTTPAQNKAAFLFAKFVTSPQFQIGYDTGSGYLPVSIPAEQSTQYQQYLKKNPFIQVFAKEMSVGKARPPIPAYSQISADIGNAIENALYGKMSASQALHQAAIAAQQALNNNG
ncbi:ABC transporter substrate-binding protein [Sulfobacillus thermosulfidooxidans]|uniref:ABC transporter substrate-binding protein n=1 Tax=Sulfobacillus thermosulfidooxidans TaxID=28034 RepID=UPI0006B5D312|nr:ABC transporter substrate-binding protein [Sulfobacillus thermosulfidooxidans]